MQLRKYSSVLRFFSPLWNLSRSKVMAQADGTRPSSFNENSSASRAGPYSWTFIPSMR